MTDDRVEWHLWNWSQLMSRSREAGAWYPSRASGGMENYRNRMDTDTDEEYDQVCKRLAAATDAAIDTLPDINKRAIHAKLLQGPWDLPEVAMGIYYRDSLVSIGRNLDRRGIV